MASRPLCVAVIVAAVYCLVVQSFHINPSSSSSHRHANNLQPLAQCRWSSTSRKTRSVRLASSTRQPSLQQKVIFQKVVRAPAGTEAVFLGYLVEYLQEHFQLPERLPMVYEKQHQQEDQDKNGRQQHTLLRWVSPLAPDSTGLDVEVVGIYADDETTGAKVASPTMAMVLVRKTPLVPLSAPMMENLFADSERRIIKALDRGLEDLCAGKIVIDKKRAKKLQEESLLAEIVQDDVESVPLDIEQKLARQRAALEVMNAELVQEPVVNEDFAVRAAKRVKEQQETEDFAVKAAREAKRKLEASAKKGKKDPKKEKELSVPVEDSDADQVESVQFDYTQIRPPSLDPQYASPRSFMRSISTPKDYSKSKDRQGKEDPNERVKRRKLNAKVEEDDGSKIEREMASPTFSSPEPDDKVQEEILKATRETLDEVSLGEDLTPEELLESVMKFSEEQEKEDVVGSGFASGAFEKAKDLLREQRQHREDRLRQEEVAESVAFDGRFLERDEDVGTAEELRRMFEAGERLADGRIEVAMRGQMTGESQPTEDEIEVDSLIQNEKTISSHARILEDELAELELRINKSPGEELDGGRKNPIFDVFSGPEVYNPNVDPEKSVNWPGAMRGSKDVKLPSELSEALKQAEFAASVLTSLEVVGEDEASQKYFFGERELSGEQVSNIKAVVKEAVEIGLIPDPLGMIAEQSRLQMLLDELWEQPEERFREIASNYNDLLLSENFVTLIKNRLNVMAERDVESLRSGDDSLETTHARERELLGHLVAYTQLLLKEARALGAELEAQQIEVIRSICKVAMDPSHKTEEETAMALTDAVRDMRPLFDDAFVAYLKFAVAEEEGRLARAGLLDDPDHNQWLFVLRIVQQGVYTELSRSINRYIDHLWYILRMETPAERRMLLEKIVDALPTLDVRPFVQVVDNIAGALGDSVSGDFDGVTELGEMTNKVLQLRRDIHELLPPERIALMSRDADEWVENRRKKLLKDRESTMKRLEASRATEHLDGEVEALGRRGEIERFE